MSTLKERLEAALALSGKSKTDIWKGCKISSGTVSLWFNGDTEQIKGKNLVCAAKILGVSPDWLASGIGPMKRDSESRDLERESSRYFPRVVGTARMGDDGYYLDLDGGNGHIEFEAEEGSVAIQVRGESMHPAIRDGWYVVIEPSGRPTQGEYVLLAFADGRKMVKELLIEKPDSYVVMSVNSGERITAMKQDLENIQAIAAVIPPSKHIP